MKHLLALVVLAAVGMAIWAGCGGGHATRTPAQAPYVTTCVTNTNPGIQGHGLCYYSNGTPVEPAWTVTGPSD